MTLDYYAVYLFGNNVLCGTYKCEGLPRYVCIMYEQTCDTSSFVLKETNDLQ